MPTNTAGTNARDLQMQLVHYYRKTVNFNDTGIAAGIRFGTLPAGAEIVNTVVKVKTVFNAATTNVLTVGTTALGVDIVAAADVNEAAVASTTVLTGNALTIAADTPIFAAYTQTGTAATTGQAVIIIAYVCNNDQ